MPSSNWSLLPYMPQERGLNHSLTHVDFMIGHEHMNIKGYTRDGQEVDIMIDGRLQV